ncbi:MAG: hypothetical protein EOP11_04425 [Proteobacteria bacterium]|nr:MAG: hypothetical protein EOP11_04425 [Pseudomonadota bacterium]
MKPKNFLTTIKLLGASFGLAALSLTACSDVKPKNFGNRQIGFDGTNDSTSTETFRFNFGYINAAAAPPLNKIVYLQGAPNSKPAITSTCNLAGTNCVCEFYNDSDVLLETADPSEMSYDSTGNYLRCEFDGTIANLKKVRVRNQNASKFSDTYGVDTPATLTLQKLIGASQDVNDVRTVSKYKCLFNYLQKQGTTELIFAGCNSIPNTCWSGFTNGNNDSSGDICLLQTTVPFHLYRSNHENNYHLKNADKLWNSEADGLVCGMQIKQYDCGGNAGTPLKDFGLYAAQAGVFETPLSLTPGPGQSVVNYGYGANTSLFGGASVCPPGMVKRIFFRAVTSTATSIGPSHNMPNTLTATEIAAPGTAPLPLEINKVGGGRCGGTLPCYPPDRPMGLVTNFPYSSAGQTEFCVIDPALLPN